MNNPPPQAFTPTVNDIRSWGSPAVFDAAQRAADKGFVTAAAFDPDTGLASGTVVVNGVPVQTSFQVVRDRWTNRPGLRSLCPCPAARERGATCFHVLAVALTLARRAVSAHRPKERAEEEEHARRVDENVARGLSVRVDPAGRPARLFLEAPRDWLPRFHRSRASDAERVPVSIRVLPDGEGAQLLPVQEFVRSREPLCLGKADENLLYLLEDVAEGDLSRPPAVGPAYLMWIFDQLGALGRPLLVAGDRPVRVRPRAEALDSHLLVSLDHESGEILIALCTDPPEGVGEGEVPGHAFFGKYAYALFGHDLYPLARVVPQMYQRVYDDTIAIPRLGTRSFLLHELDGLRGQFDVRFDEGFSPDAFTWTPAAPRFRLRASVFDDRDPHRPVRSDALDAHAVLRAELDALYPPDPRKPDKPTVLHANAPGKDFSFPDPDDPYNYFVRNLPAERAALVALAAHGLVPPAAAHDPASLRGNALSEAHGADALLTFLASTAPSLQALPGWTVDYEPPLADVSGHLERIAVLVHVERPADAPGAFDLDYSFQTVSRSRPVPAKDVGEARNQGRAWVVHGGRRQLFDPAALDQFADVLRECGARPVSRDGTTAVRIGNACAPFLVGRLERLAPSNVLLDRASRPWADRVRGLFSPGAAPDAADPVAVAEPLRGMLRPYQRAGVAWLRALERGGMGGILADEMGLGKTVQTLAWLSLPRFSPGARGLPALVVCPTSLVENWAEEARRFTPSLRLLVASGETREALLSEDPDTDSPRAPRILDPDALADALSRVDVAITSYALLRRDVAAYERAAFSVVVLDEAQNIKNRQTQNAETVKRLPASCRLAVTGTPIENSPADLWSIVDFLMRGFLGDWDDFRARYEVPISLRGAPGATPQQNREADEALARLRDRIGPFLLRRLKSEVARDLPPKTVQTVFSELSDEQRAVYAKFFHSARTQVADAIGSAGFDKSRMLVLTALLRLRQICCHLALLGPDGPGTAAARPSSKLDWLLEFLAEAAEEGHRVLVFSQFVEMLSLVRAALEASRTPFCYLDGTTHDRAEQVHRFNSDPSVPVFLISLKAGGTGLNLTGADEVVLFDPWWNPAIEDQAIDRAHRIGQRRHVRAIKLVTRGTIEEKVLAMQQRKRAVISATIGATDSAILASLTEGDVRALFEL